MARFREHGVLIYLSNKLYMGFVKLQAEKGLGRSFAALLPFVEGLYKLGYITEEVYLEHKEKYSQPLIKKKPVTKQQRNELAKIETLFSGALEQWETMPDKSRAYYVEKAKQHVDDVANAEQVLNRARTKTLEDHILLSYKDKTDKEA